MGVEFVCKERFLVTEGIENRISREFQLRDIFFLKYFVNSVRRSTVRRLLRRRTYSFSCCGVCRRTISTLPPNSVSKTFQKKYFSPKVHKNEQNENLFFHNNTWYLWKKVPMNAKTWTFVKPSLWQILAFVHTWSEIHYLKQTWTFFFEFFSSENLDVWKIKFFSKKKRFF